MSNHELMMTEPHVTVSMGVFCPNCPYCGHEQPLGVTHPLPGDPTRSFQVCMNCKNNWPLPKLTDPDAAEVWMNVLGQHVFPNMSDEERDTWTYTLLQATLAILDRVVGEKHQALRAKDIAERSLAVAKGQEPR